MALILRELYRGYFWIFNELADPRATDMFLMSSPFPIIGCGLFYLYLVLDWGPKYMENRKPFNLDKIIIIYNIFQVAVNLYIFAIGAKQLTRLNWGCAPIQQTGPDALLIINTIYLFFLTKLTDLLDTIFFILRKKGNQASFLHIYHHFGMIFVSWIGVKFLGGGHSIFMGTVNCFVHACMYFYYLLTSLWPEYRRSIWWKKHITHLQLVQFIFNVIIYGQLFFKPDCEYPKIASYFFVPQNILMLLLFGEFYINAYVKTKHKGVKSKLLNCKSFGS